MKLGTNLPKHLVGGDHGAIRAFVHGVAEIGYSYLCFGDHVLGADFTARPEWRPQQGKPPSQTLDDAQPEIFVLFGLLAGMTRTLELSTAILISPQRQTALLAKRPCQDNSIRAAKAPAPPLRSCSYGGRRPRLMSRGPELAEGRSADQVRLAIERVVDSGVGGEETLGLSLRFQPLHLPLPAPDRQV